MSPPPIPESPLVDTNILFDFLVRRFHNESRTDIHPSLLNYLAAKPLQALEWYFGAAEPIQTTIHVIAEVHGLLKRRTQSKPEWSSSTRGSFWRFAREKLLQADLQEHAATLKNMDPDDLAQMGPTDASLSFLAIKLGAVVLTEDGLLRQLCSKKEIPVLNYQSVLELWKLNVP